MQPVHLIWPNPPFTPTLIQNIFPKCVVRTHSRCLKRTPGSHLQAAQVPLTPAHQFCRRPAKSPLPDSRFSPRYTQFSPITGSSLDLDFPLDYLQWLLLIVMCLNQCLRHLLHLQLLLLDLLLHQLIAHARAAPDG